MSTSETSISGSGKEESTEQPKLEETESVLVTFVRDDDGSSKLVKDVQLSDSVGGMKLFISSQWNGPADDIAISYVGETLSSNTTVEQLGATPGQAIELQVHLPPPISVDPQPHVAAVSSAHGGEGGGGGGGVYDMGRSSSSTEGMYRLPGSIIVEVKADHGMKEVLVNVEQSQIKKPFLGGYRHKETGIEYHHASSQTLPKRRPDNDMAKFDRDTQTVKTRNAYQQVMVDATTQMDRTGCFISDRMDMILFPGPYETADEYHAKILEKVIVLQSYWRRWLGKRYVEDLRIEKKRRAEWERAEALRREQEREERRKREFERRMNPHSKEDFELLYHALEMWRQEELERINQTTSGAERKAALCMLLEQEAHLIASIGKHKISAKEDMREDQIRKFLDTVAAPKKWIAFDGTITEMDTPHTLRACQLRDLYNSITMKGLSSEERLDVLLTLKATVREHDCKLTRELVELVDREADLIVREMKESTLEGLRRRIATLFLQYCKTPLFNAEAAKHIKVPQDPSTLRTHVYYCRSCSQYLPSTDFELSTNSRVIGHCRRCKELDNQARAREDFTLYRAMMKTIRRTEEEYKDGSHFIFLMQEPDLRYLVENIWGCQSALSGEKDLFELMMVRWNCSKPWSPWNCVLLTKPEAQGHTKLDLAEKAYGAQFVQKVHHRHVLARNYFSRVPGMMEKMEEKVLEMPLPRPKERVLTVPWRRDVNQLSSSKSVTPVVDPV